MGKVERNIPQSDTLTNLLAPLEALQNLIAEFKDQGVIIGGVAAILPVVPISTSPWVFFHDSPRNTLNTRKIPGGSNLSWSQNSIATIVALG
jgi:hypothetical protein